MTQRLQFAAAGHLVGEFLQRDLGARGDAEAVAHGADHPPELARRQQGRRAAADEDRRGLAERPELAEEPKATAKPAIDAKLPPTTRARGPVRIRKAAYKATVAKTSTELPRRRRDD